MGNITVQIANGADNHQFKVGRENALVLQTYEVSFRFPSIFNSMI